MAEGHLLVEDHPGVGKTTLAKALARSLGLGFGRIQLTADLLPADVTGAVVFDRDTGLLAFRPGPVFTNILLADELNRASPKASRPSWKQWKSTRCRPTAPAIFFPGPLW